MLKFLIGVSVILTLSACASQTKKSQTFPDQASIYPTALKGDLRPVLAWASQSTNDQLSPEQLALKKKYLARFPVGDPKPTPIVSGLTGDVLRVHERYWRKALRQDFATEEDGYRYWFGELKTLAETRGRKVGSYGEKEAEDLINYFKAALLTEGYHSLIGRTKPYMDLMLWRNESIQTYPINLGDESITVKVVMMDDFLTYGWLGFATFDDKKTGGWAEKDHLRCVKPSYDITSEQFRVSYLAHEGRHFSDYKKFPKLESADLEYRAKLTELIFANNTLFKLLKHFAEEAANDPASGHAFASFNLVKNLAAKLGQPISSRFIDTLDSAVVKKAATELLHEHTVDLQKLSALETRGLFAR